MAYIYCRSVRFLIRSRTYRNRTSGFFRRKYSRRRPETNYTTIVYSDCVGGDCTRRLPTTLRTDWTKFADTSRRRRRLIPNWTHADVDWLIHSGYLFSASSSPLLLRGAPDTARILCRSFTPKRHRQLAQCPYVAARMGFEPTTLRTKDVESTNAPPRPTTPTNSDQLTRSVLTCDSWLTMTTSSTLIADKSIFQSSSCWFCTRNSVSLKTGITRQCSSEVWILIACDRQVGYLHVCVAFM